MREPRKRNLGNLQRGGGGEGPAGEKQSPTPRGHDHRAISEQTGCSVGESRWFGDKVTPLSLDPIACQMQTVVLTLCGCWGKAHRECQSSSLHPFPPPAIISSFCKSVSLLLFCKSVHLYHFFLNSTCRGCHDTSPSQADLLQCDSL